MSKELSRHDIREMAVQSLFPLDFSTEFSKQDAIAHAIEVNQYDLLDEEEENFVPDYLDWLVSGVCEHKNELDKEIESFLRPGWKIGRLAKMDVTILRLAIFEMQHAEDVPNKVVLNEAIELTKTFSDDQSRKFVNGVLSSINNKLEADGE
ncbi:transcription antitermination factor NusB [Enterococcus italicus]|uniref:Transcription antitermination protein NusB n=1 Tax=Enterococcus italicus (strain DSM 15952 / CCUG 50447 / LMG 22039 / TP 1.5) TaxID=888064 RepID=E6LCL1_ENTI1|nr:transcription antitermination factor NusB [Enterococcus italicus]EFU75053.1 transcription antitermination factor NusB [Enterococcus italicus DSM 15952]HCS29992.1 transcription antitermination factor NusB [Enterococcus sp.]